tara:strand:+ start:270 stop:455 length:186 start_codon:yes stop_codon:yes gene_type:complete
MIDTLQNTILARSEVGMGATIGSAIVNYTQILNPVLSTLTLLIGIAVGLCTLIIKWREIAS